MKVLAALLVLTASVAQGQDGTTTPSLKDATPRSSTAGSPSSAAPSSNHSATPSVVNHLDAITDMIVTRIPYPMVLSSGRDGVIKCWI